MVDEPTHRISGDGADDGHGVPLRQFGPFRVIERIGRGGMGEVFLAERDEPRQRVALKVIRADKVGRVYRARFEVERETLARMDHTNIARFYDAGEADGLLWFAMEYVPGQPLDDYCREHKLTLAQRLAVFAQVCDGVQHAHMKGVLHRDLKPANVLVREIDGHSVAKIVDFGLAHPVDPTQLRDTLVAEIRQFAGTIGYMSPEQAECSTDLDIRADVYSLGVVLYELLTGQLPTDFGRLRADELALLGQFLRLHEPPKPSTKLSRLGAELTSTAAERRVSPKRLRSLVRGELDWVTMRALAADRRERYATVRELGQDIERFLKQQPVSAGPPSTVYVLRKWVRRNAGVVATAGGAMMLVVGLTANAIRLAGVAEAAESRRDRVAQAAVIAEHVRRAEEDLWPADGAHAPLLEEWLQQTPRLLAQRDALVALSAELREEALASTDTGTLSVVASQQESVARGLGKLDDLAKLSPVVAVRLRRAVTLTERTIRDHQPAWDTCRAALAKDARFEAFILPDVPGLVPLGGNPQSGLQEFYLLDSAGEFGLPERRADGGFDVGPMTGLVFVLLPGGAVALPEVMMGHGARSADVKPFLLAKYEITQAQWSRLCAPGETDAKRAAEFNVSNEPDWLQRIPGGPAEPRADAETIDWRAVTWIHPVQQVSWQRANQVLRRWGMRIPSVDQWWHGASGGVGGRDGLSWLGTEPQTFANLWDLGEAQPERLSPEMALRDGFVWTGPVGLLRPNGFGLYDVIGNVGELCADCYSEGQVVDGAMADQRRVHMGMHYRSSWNPGQVGRAAQIPTQNISHMVGVRPMLQLP